MSDGGGEVITYMCMHACSCASIFLFNFLSIVDSKIWHFWVLKKGRQLRGKEREETRVCLYVCEYM